MIEITKEFKFEMAHVLSEYLGPCGNLHGHSYRCLVSFKLNKNSSKEYILPTGMVIDFNDVKTLIGDIIDSMDHAFAYNIYSKDSFEIDIANLCKSHNKKIVEFPHRTTAELMAKSIWEKISNKLKDSIYNEVICSKVQLFETTTGNALYHIEEN